MKIRIKLITSVICCALGVSSYAVDGTWNSALSGNWTDTANWIGNVVAEGGSSILTGPSLGQSRTITLDEPHTIGGLNMNVNGFNRSYTFTGTGSITLDNGANPVQIRGVNGPNIINVPLHGTPASIQYAWQVGRIVLNGANTYAAPVYIYRGEVRIGHVDALPHGSRLGNITMVTGGNPGNFPAIDLDVFDITINGLDSDTNLVGTLPKITSASATGGTSTISIGDNDQNGTYDGTIDDGVTRIVAVTKVGNGTQSLRGNNTYTGPTTVSGGVLAVDGIIASVATVNGGVLAGNGTVFSQVTVGAGGAISGGNGIGILTTYGVDLSAGGTNIWELNEDTTSGPGVNYDQISVQGAPFDLTDSTLIVKLGGNVDVNDAFWTSSQTWTIISSPGVTGSSNFKTVVVTGAEAPGNFTTANDSVNVTLTFTPGIVKKTPVITSIVKTPTSATVNYYNTFPGTNYVLQYRTNVALGNWVSVATNAAAGTSSSSVDNTAGAGVTERYYRVYYFFAP